MDDDRRRRAVTRGRIADVLEARGQIDEALRIHIEEELPVYERLGDVRSRAIAQSGTADILEARGQLDEALKVYERHVLQDIEAIGNPVEAGHVRGRIGSLRSSLARSAKRRVGRGDTWASRSPGR